MAKGYLPYDVDQQLLLPPDMRQWLPEGHLALFILDIVRELELSALHQAHKTKDARGRAGYHPVMMLALLVYAYCAGKPSSRKIERATYEDVAFRVLSGDQHPDHDSIAAFRKDNLAALAGLFTQVLQLCRAAGLVKLGHIAIDGTKIKANASKHNHRSRVTHHARQRQQRSVPAGLQRAGCGRCPGANHRGGVRHPDCQRCAATGADGRGDRAKRRPAGGHDERRRKATSRCFPSRGRWRTPGAFRRVYKGNPSRTRSSLC